MSALREGPESFHRRSEMLPGMPGHLTDGITTEVPSLRRRMIVSALSSVALSAAACAAPPKLSQGLGAENIPVTFQTTEGWTYDGRIEL